MGKLDVHMVRYLTPDDYRILTAVEMGMKNHEIVPSTLISMIAKLRSGGCCKILRNLCKNRLLCHENVKKVEGFRLSFTGYDYLAIKTLIKQGHISFFGNQIGVGKESDVYMVQNDDGVKMALKIHRLGRTSFRKLKEKRDYLKHRQNYSWLYLSRLAAIKEFAFMKALYNRDFPIPTPIAHNRHCVLMQLMIDHVMLSQLANDLTIEQRDTLYDALMNILIRLAKCGVIHGDFNEFNIMFNPHDLKDIILIDFPQMVPTTHPNAEWYFDRDVQGIVSLFKRKFGYHSQIYPKLSDILTQGVPSPIRAEDKSDVDYETHNENEQDINTRLSGLTLGQDNSTSHDIYREAMGDMNLMEDNSKCKGPGDEGGKLNSLAQTSLLDYFLQSLPDPELDPPSDQESSDGSETSSAEQAAIIPIFAPPRTTNNPYQISDKIVIEPSTECLGPCVATQRKQRTKLRKSRTNHDVNLKTLDVEDSSSDSCGDPRSLRGKTGTSLATTVFEADVVKRRIQREVKKKKDHQMSRRACKAGQSRMLNQARRLNNITIQEERSAL